MTTNTNLLATASNTLGFNLWKTIRSTKGNLAISPASISTALTMTWAGARGDTAAEMSKALNLDISPEVAMSEYARLTAGLLYDANFAGIDLAIANRLFGEKTLTFNEAFIDDMREAYGAGLEKLDFQNNSEGARAFINSWIEDKTKSRIKDLLTAGSVDDTTQLVLVNALYFMANWAAQFNKSSTMKDVFKGNGENHECQMMRRKGEYRFSQGREASVIELPYVGNSASMIVVLPNDVDGLTKLEQSFSNDTLTVWRRQLREQTVVVQLPRFTIDPSTPISLSGHLRELGMEKAFSPDTADFTGILKEKIAISEVYHKTFIKVNEEGTEMAAATAVAMMRGISMDPHFRADHPFAWFIVDSTSDLVLGMGRVEEPIE